MNAAIATTLGDVRLAARSLLRVPTLVIVTVLTLAVAIGANTAIYSVVRAVLLRPLPYVDPDRIVRVAATLAPEAYLPGFSGSGGSHREAYFSNAGYWHLVHHNRSFAAVGGYRPRPQPAPLTGETTPVQVTMAQMARSAFDVLGVKPERGRLPAAGEDEPNGPKVALISHRFWQSHYGGDPSIVGRTIQLWGQSTEVIGVMPSSYGFPSPETDVWVPLRLDPGSADYEGHNIAAIARLAPGQTLEAAAADARRLVLQFPEIGYPASWFGRVFDGNARVWTLKEDIVGDISRPLLILAGTAGLVLLIACGNVANLLLVRVESLAKANATRLALGSGRGPLIRRAAVESALLSAAGGVLGILLAYVVTRVLVVAAPATIPRLEGIRVSGAVLAFTAVVSGAAAVLFGTAPTLVAASPDSMAGLLAGSTRTTVGRHRLRAQGALVVAQVSLAVIVSVGSGLMVRSFSQLSGISPGFDAQRVLTLSVRPLPSKYPSATARAQLYETLLAKLKSVPAVTATGGIDYLPLTGHGTILRATIDGAPLPDPAFPPSFLVRRITTGYVETMKMPVLEGRSFTADDERGGRGAVVVSSSVKRRYWPNESAIGKRLVIEGEVAGRVVGVVGDVHDVSLESAPEQFIYLPLIDSTGVGAGPMTLVVRTSVDPEVVTATVRSAISDVDVDLPVGAVRSLQSLVAASVSTTTFTMALLIVGAAIAIFLGGVGIYGVLSYVVTQRTPEIAVRLAVGARKSDIGRLVLFQGLRLATMGVVAGMIISVAVVQLLRSLLYNVSPFDPLTFLGAATTFLIIAASAILLPALRASRTDTTAALRAE